jgi:U3 small nucleolar RNA-associated protein 22
LIRTVGDSGFSSSKCLIHIIPAAPQDFFNEIKLRPNKNALRPKTISADINYQLAPTPFYNATVRADSNIKEYLNLLQRSSKHAGGFKDACILGRIWLRQRAFGGTISAGGFGHFEWATLTALLLQGGGPRGQSVLSPAYSSYQLFKAVIQYLSNTNFTADPVFFQAPEVSVPSANSPIFYDGPRGHNILFKMTPWSYARLLEEAKISIEMLNESAFDQFEATFVLRKDHPLQEYDISFQLPNSTAVEESSPDHANRGARVCSKTYAILREGLTDRVKIIHLKTPESVPWPLKATPSITDAEIFVGVVFDPANVGKLVDHGPAAEDKKSAAQFRKFWGEKAELRRFKDGSIFESLVWSNNSDALIFKEIVVYLLNRHLGAEIGKIVKFTGHNFSRLLPGSDSSMKAFGNLKSAFNTLEQDIRGMESLPLQPKMLSAISPQLRLSSVVQPNFSPHQHLREPVEVLLQFEGSGRWPDDIIAIQQTKVAFLLKIGDLLAASVVGVTTRLLIENMERPLFNYGVLDVIYPSGAAFRLRIYIDREQVLLERLIKEKSTHIHTREEAISAKSLVTYMCIQLPLHNQSVATHCTRYPALSPTIRLVKKWFTLHMLSGHIREELVELFVLRIFLQPHPWRAPSSANTGLLRTLQFLSRWDWRVTPLIIDFSGTMTNEDVAAINSRLEAWRKIDPGMNRVVLLAASNHDVTATAFTDGRPSKVVATRMTALARSACQTAKHQVLDLDMETLFRSTTDDYDFVVYISPKFATYRKDKKNPNTTKFKNLEVQAEDDLSLAGYEPVLLFLEEVQRLYRTSIVFFHDPLTNLAIGGLWNPDTKCRTLKTNLSYGTMPTSSDSRDHQDSEVEIDRLAILSEIARLGGDIVERIEVHR